MFPVHHIFVSPGHNFFGHHGGPAGTHVNQEVDEVRCVAGMGLEGDRFFDHATDYKGQITFFAREVLDDVCRRLGIEEPDPGSVRRNVIVSGVDLDALIGKEFEVQGIRFLGVEECKPCYWMDLAMGPGAEDLLVGRGGLRCRILTSGVLRKSAP